MGLNFTKIVRCIAILLTVAFAHFDLKAQSDFITGQVKDEDGGPLPGANIIVKGTTAGTSTDSDGRYSIQLRSQNDVLVFSFVGYLSQEIPVAGKSVINVTLDADVHTMGEIVVVGYGTQRRESVTGAISQISGAELLKAPVGNLTNTLAGRVPGVISLQQSGQPGADASSILVRGSAAKYIVDGVERSFSEIDPNEIETISVLKDASSAAIYGLDANAVIIITTKRGKNEQSRISFTATHGVSSNALMLDMLDGPGYAYWHNRAR
ncbi:MAG TPA: carboxypeptidase-like regulatory domain-containing protein, partial [Chryseosolibacter sp.]